MIHKKVVALFLMLSMLLPLLCGCSSTGSPTPEALVERYVESIARLDGEDIMNCMVPSGGGMYNFAVQIGASMTGQSPEKAMREEARKSIADMFGLDESEVQKVKGRAVVVSKEEEDATATVRAIAILEIGKKQACEEIYFVTSKFGSNWYVSNMLYTMPRGYTPTKVMVNDKKLENMLADLDKNKLTAKIENRQENIDLINHEAAKKQLSKTWGKIVAIYEYEDKVEFSGAERMFAMGYVESLTDAVSNLVDVSEGGLIRGHEIVHDMAYYIMNEDLAELNEQLDALNWFMSVLTGMTESTKALLVGSMPIGSAMQKFMEAAENVDSVYDLYKSKATDSEFVEAFRKLRNIERLPRGSAESIEAGSEFHGFGSLEDAFAFAQFMRKMGLIIDTTTTVVDMTKKITDYKIASQFADLYIADLQRMRDTTHSSSFKHDLDEFINQIKRSDLIAQIQGCLHISNWMDGVGCTIDVTTAVYGLANKGFFGERIRSMAAKLLPEELVSGVGVATTIAGLPSFIAGLFGYDTDGNVRAIDKLQSILPVLREEIDYLCSFGTVTQRNYKEFEDQYHLCLMLSRAWCEFYLASCETSMNFLEKEGLWTESKVRKAAANIKAFIEEIDIGLKNVNMVYLEEFSKMCHDVEWGVSN